LRTSWSRRRRSRRRRCARARPASARRAALEREKINAILQEIIDEQTAPWGIKVSVVEVKDVEICRACNALWPARLKLNANGAKVINAEGEFKLRAAQGRGRSIEEHPVALQLAPQTLLELGGSASTTVVFPFPIDVLAVPRTARAARLDRPAARTAGR
jgi:regulator of protease activity HflC (stomatin/prohibitin superfamily)